MSLSRSLPETAGVVGLGLAIAATANGLSDKGLSLTRDYFPSARAQPASQDIPDAPEEGAAPVAGTDEQGDPTAGADGDVTDDSGSTEPATDATVDAVPTTPAADPGEPSAQFPAELMPTVERLQGHGFTVVTLDEVVATHSDPLYQYGAYVIIDARKEDDYASGHLSGAFRYYHFHPEENQEEVLLACQGFVERIVVYRNGGDCEDSENTALYLTQFGIDPGLMHIFLGGIEEWKGRGLPLEQGAQHSGEIVNAGDEGYPR